MIRVQMTRTHVIQDHPFKSIKIRNKAYVIFILQFTTQLFYDERIVWIKKYGLYTSVSACPRRCALTSTYARVNARKYNLRQTSIRYNLRSYNRSFEPEKNIDIYRFIEKKMCSEYLLKSVVFLKKDGLCKCTFFVVVRSPAYNKR